MKEKTIDKMTERELFKVVDFCKGIDNKNADKLSESAKEQLHKRFFSDKLNVMNYKGDK